MISDSHYRTGNALNRCQLEFRFSSFFYISDLLFKNDPVNLIILLEKKTNVVRALNDLGYPGKVISFWLAMLLHLSLQVNNLLTHRISLLEEALQSMTYAHMHTRTHKHIHAHACTFPNTHTLHGSCAHAHDPCKNVHIAIHMRTRIEYM